MQDGTKQIQWRRPVREHHASTGFTWRRYLSRCRQFRISVRVAGLESDPRKRFYAERWLDRWAVIGTYRSRQAAVRACEKDLRQLARKEAVCPTTRA